MLWPPSATVGLVYRIGLEKHLQVAEKLVYAKYELSFLSMVLSSKFVGSNIQLLQYTLRIAVLLAFLFTMTSNSREIYLGLRIGELR